MYTESHIFPVFDPVLPKLYVLGLRVLEHFCAFSRAFSEFRAVRIMGKLTSRHLFFFGGFERLKVVDKSKP